MAMLSNIWVLTLFFMVQLSLAETTFTLFRDQIFQETTRLYLYNSTVGETYIHSEQQCAHTQERFVTAEEMDVLLREPHGYDFFTPFDHICVTENKVYDVASRSVVETNPSLCHAYVCTPKCLDLDGVDGCEVVRQFPHLCDWGDGWKMCRRSCDKCPNPCQGEWSDRSECSATCGPGMTTQTWNVLQARELGGGSCPYSDQETYQEDCFLQPCQTCVLDRDQILYDLGTTHPPTELPTAAPTVSEPDPIVILQDWSTKGYINQAAYGTAFTDGSGVNLQDCERNEPMFGNPDNVVLNGDRCFVNINDGVEDDREQNDDSAWAPSGDTGYVGVKLTERMEITAIRISRHYSNGLEGLVGVSRTLDDIETYDGGEWEILTHVNQTEEGNYYVIFDPPVNATAIKLNVSNPNHVLDEMQIWVADPEETYLAGFYSLMGEMGVIDRSGNENDLVNHFAIDLGGEQGEGMQFREVNNYVRIKNKEIHGTSFSIAMEFNPQSSALAGPMLYFHNEAVKGCGIEQQSQHVKVDIKTEVTNTLLSMYARDTLTLALQYYKIVLVVGQHEQWLYVDDVLYDHRYVRFEHDFDINKDVFLGWYVGSANKIVGRLRCLKLWRGMITDEEVSSAFDDCLYEPVPQWESAERVKCANFEFHPFPEWANLESASTALCQTWCERLGDSCYGTFFYHLGAPIINQDEREGCYLCESGQTEYPHDWNYILRKPVKVWPQWTLVYWEVEGAVLFDLGEESTNKLFQDSRYNVLRYDKQGEPWGVYRRYSELDTFQVYDIITGPWLSELGREDQGDFRIYETLEHSLMDYPKLSNCGMYDEPGVGFPGSCGNDPTSWHDVEGTNIYSQNTVGFWVGVVEESDDLKAGDIKLRGGDGIRYGIVMYWNGLQYGTVCMDADHADSKVADVICRSLGFENGGEFCHSPSYSASEQTCTFTWPNLNAEGTLPALQVDGRYCTGDENSIEECPDWDGYLANCNSGQEIGVTCSLGSDDLLDPIDDAYAAEWEHFPDWVVKSGEYPCEYLVLNNGTENPDNTTQINNIITTMRDVDVMNITSIDIALEKCRYTPKCSMVNYNASSMTVQYCQLPPTGFDESLVLQDRLGTHWYGYLETSADTGAWGYTLSRGYSIPESSISRTEVHDGRHVLITQPKDCADMCDAVPECTGFTFPESAYKPTCHFTRGNPYWAQQEEHYIDYYVKTDRPLADPAILTVQFSESEMSQEGGLTLSPIGDVVVNPEGEAIFKGDGYFILSGDFSSWGPDLTICLESRQYVTGRDENIFLLEGHDHFHEGFRQLSIHMPSPATDYKVIFDAGSNSNYITKVDWNRVDAESKLLGRWVSYCFVKDHENEKLDIYLNREILATANFSESGTSYPLDLTRVTQIGIGGPVLYGQADDDQVYIGELRNFRVWNTAFTERQVKYYQKPIRQYDPILETKLSDLSVPGAIFNYSSTFVPNGDGAFSENLMSINDFGTAEYHGSETMFTMQPYYSIEGPLDFAESSLTVCWNAFFGEIGVGPDETDPLPEFDPEWSDIASQFWFFPMLKFEPKDNDFGKSLRIFYALPLEYSVLFQNYLTYFIAIELIDENHRIFVNIKEYMGQWTNFCFVKDDARRSMYLTINSQLVYSTPMVYYQYVDPTPDDLTDNPVDYTEAFYTKSWESISVHAFREVPFSFRDVHVWDRVIDPYTLSPLRYIIPDSLLGFQFTLGEDHALVNITQNDLVEMEEVHGSVLFEEDMVTFEGHGFLDYATEEAIVLRSYTVCFVVDQHQVPTEPFAYPESMMILDMDSITFEAATPDTGHSMRWTNKAMYLENDPNNGFWHADLFGISPDRRQSVCAVQDFSASRYRIYLNGLIGAQGPIMQILPGNVQNVRIGMDLSGGRPFLGRVQSVNLWNEALDDNRIHEIHMRQMDLFPVQLWTTTFTTDVGIWHTMDDPDLHALYVPQCDDVGLYLNKQCDDSDFCWCVHRQDRTRQLEGEGLDPYLTCDAPSVSPSVAPSQNPTTCPSFGPSVDPSKFPTCVNCPMQPEGHFEGPQPDPTGDDSYTCGTTMEECEAAYMAAMTPAVTAMMATETMDSCDAADGWWVVNTLNGLAGYDADTMSVCQSGGEYMIQYNGMVYPTCVAYGDPDNACGDSDLICPENPNNVGVFGYAGNQRAALASALTRNDFMHPMCPTSTCKSMDELADSGSYWKTQLMNNQYTNVDESTADNVCVTEDNEVMFITTEGKYNTCLGWSSNAAELCDSQKFLCAGHNGQGLYTYGWPGQLARTLAKAVTNTDGNYMHPQCPLMICSA